LERITIFGRGNRPLLALARLSAIFSVLTLTSSAFGQQAMYPLKEGIVQPIHSSDIPSWMTLDMELRGRTEDQSSLGLVQNKDRAYELTRVWGGLTVRPTEWLTGYAQFMDTHALGLPLQDTAANMRDSFDLRQGYLDFHYKPAQLLVGRFELRIGDERVVGISDWTNNSRTWDGAYLRIGSVNQLNFFTTSVVTVHPTSLDTHGAGLTFHGVHAKLATFVPHTTIEPFVLFHDTRGVVGNQAGVKGNQTEVTFGSYYKTEWYGFDSSGTGDLQRGSYSNDSIQAWSAIVRGGYGAEHLPWKPHLEAEYDYATGNDHSNPNRWSTFDQQYPSNHNAFGLVDLFGFQNIKQRRVNLNLTPKENFLVLLQGGSLHLATVHDGVYSSGGTFTPLVAAPAGGFKSDDLGSQFDASAKYIYHKSFVTNIGVGHFFPGEAMTTGAPTKHAPLTYAYLGFTYRFKLEH
jgi:Alginate export